MGRVYNALVKADRLTGRERPIGRPSSQDAPTKAAEIFRAQVAPIANDENSATEFSVNYGRAASAPVFQSDSNFSLTETFAAPSAIAPLAIAPPAIVFEEPREVASVKSL